MMNESGIITEGLRLIGDGTLWSGNHSRSDDRFYNIIFNTEQQILLIGLYVLILILGLTFNAAIVWVIVARPSNRTPRNMYVVNLAISGIVMAMVCVPPTLLQILYGGWWHLDVFSCKLVPTIQGANILVSAFTIVVIAVDRWRSVVNTCPRENSLTFKAVFTVIFLVWLLAFIVMSPLLAFQLVERMTFPGTDVVFFQACVERFPGGGYKTAFTMVILVVQYCVPLVVLPVVHSKILCFLRMNTRFANDARRKERELKRNRRMTLVLSGISIIFAISWLPLHLYLILTDILYNFQSDKEMYFLVLGLCHAMAMSSSFTNPVMYGWCNTSLRAELETLLPERCFLRRICRFLCSLCSKIRQVCCCPVRMPGSVRRVVDEDGKGVSSVEGLLKQTELPTRKLEPRRDVDMVLIMSSTCRKPPATVGGGGDGDGVRGKHPETEDSNEDLRITSGSLV